MQENPLIRGVGIELQLVDGQGALTGFFTKGGILIADSEEAVDIDLEVGVYTGGTSLPEPYLSRGINITFYITGPVHQTLRVQPSVGNITDTEIEVIYEDPATVNPENPELSYNSPPFYQLILVIFNETGKYRQTPTGCLLSKNLEGRVGYVTRQTIWLENNHWRSHWSIEGLVSSTEYMAIAIQGGTKVSLPAYFSTQSRKTPLFLVHRCLFLTFFIKASTIATKLIKLVKSSPQESPLYWIIKKIYWIPLAFVVTPFILSVILEGIFLAAQRRHEEEQIKRRLELFSRSAYSQNI